MATGKKLKIFVGGLSWKTSDSGFLEYFQAHGEVEDAVVMRNEGGKSRGFGFITYRDPAVAERVLQLKDMELDGRKIEVKNAVPKDEMEPSKPADISERRTNKIFIGGLAPNTTKEDFEQYFGKYGTITDAIVMTDRDSGRPRGFGFVTFEDDTAADKVMADGVHMICDKEVECKKAIPREETPVRDRDRDRDHRRDRGDRDRDRDRDRYRSDRDRYGDRYDDRYRDDRYFDDRYYDRYYDDRYRGRDGPRDRYRDREDRDRDYFRERDYDRYRERGYDSYSYERRLPSPPRPAYDAKAYDQRAYNATYPPAPSQPTFGYSPFPPETGTNGYPPPPQAVPPPGYGYDRMRDPRAQTFAPFPAR